LVEKRHRFNAIGERAEETPMTDTSLWRRAPGRGAGLRGRTSPFLTRAEHTLEALRRERDFSSAVIDTVGALIVVLDADGRIVEFNRSCEQITGYTYEELRGKPLWECLLLPAEAGRVKSLFEELSGEELPRQFENYWVTKDGRKRLIAWQNTALMDETGEVEFVIGTGIDVTDQRKAEDDLKNSEERFRSLVQNSSDILMLAGPDASLTYVSDSVERIMGYRPSDLLGKIGFDFVHPEDLDEVAARFSQLVSKPGSIVTVESRAHHKNGSWRWTEATLQNLLHDPNIEGIVVNMRDITQRKLAEQALVQTEATLRSLLDQLPIGVTFRNKEGIASEVNQAALTMLGASPEHFLGASPEEFAGTFQVSHLSGEPLDADELPSMRVLREAREIGPLELLYTRPEHSVRRMWVSAAPVMLDVGELIGSVEVLMDVTDQRTMEDQLRQAQKLEAVGQLAGGVAHDFNNLLSVIENYAQFAAEDLPHEAQSRQDIQEVIKAAQRGANLVRQLLAFSRKDVVQPVVLDLNEIVLEMERLLRRTLGEHVELSVELGSELLLLYLGGGQLEQIIMNLCVNARDAMPEGGRLELRTSNEGPGSESDGRSFVCLEVSDTGRGMSEDVKARIFEPFFTTKERGWGTGLGLATVYGIVERAGGRITVESELERGTNFKVYLPAVSDRVVETSVLETEGVFAGGGERILVTEDERPVRELVQRILARNGYEVLVAASSSEAIELFRAGDIDMLLTDVVMPGGSGSELAARLRELDPGVRVLFMSGYADAGEGLVTGAETLQKPFSARDLLQEVRRTLDAVR
jgi:two-component system, cell cycle sensor histidine kinase and response regulator CckA